MEVLTTNLSGYTNTLAIEDTGMILSKKIPSHVVNSAVSTKTTGKGAHELIDAELNDLKELATSMVVNVKALGDVNFTPEITQILERNLPPTSVTTLPISKRGNEALAQVVNLKPRLSGFGGFENKGGMPLMNMNTNNVVLKNPRKQLLREGMKKHVNFYENRL